MHQALHAPLVPARSHTHTHGLLDCAHVATAAGTRHAAADSTSALHVHPELHALHAAVAAVGLLQRAQPLAACTSRAARVCCHADDMTALIPPVLPRATCILPATGRLTFGNARRLADGGAQRRMCVRRQLAAAAASGPQPRKLACVNEAAWAAA